MKRTIMILGSLAIWGAPAGLAHVRPASAAEGQAPAESRADYARRIRAEIEQIKAGVKERDDAAAKAVRRKTKAVEKELARLEKAGESDWTGLKIHVERSMKDLRKAFHDLV